MNINKFTQSSMAAVQNLEKIAADYGNHEIEQEHLLYSLLTIDDSLILKLIEKMGITKETMMNRVEELLRKRPKVQGGQMYIGQNLNNVLIHGEDEAKQMGDEYVSVEHLFLALLKYANREIKGMMKELGITRESFLQVLSSVRGNQRVTSDNPEATYDTLNKYGEDLVGVGHQAAGAQNLTQTANAAHHIGGSHDDVKIHEAAGDLCDQLVIANDISASSLGSSCCGALSNSADADGLAGAVGQNDSAADLLVSVTAINAQTDVLFCNPVIQDQFLL